MDTQALFKMGYGLYVVTANHDDKDNGCIVNACMQITSNPCQIAVAINKSNYTCSLIQETNKLNLSVLSEDVDFEIIKRFGFQCGRLIDKFDGFYDVKRSPNGLLYLTRGTNAYISAYVKQAIDFGTHILFIAQFVGGEVLNDVPTLTYDYYQKHIKPKQTTDSVKGWRCKVCGYIYKHEELPADYICPICKHGAVDFEKIG